MRNNTATTNYFIAVVSGYVYSAASRLGIENSKLRNRRICQSCRVSFFTTLFPKIKHISKIDHVDSFYSKNNKTVLIH